MNKLTVGTIIQIVDPERIGINKAAENKLAVIIDERLSLKWLEHWGTKPHNVKTGQIIYRVDQSSLDLGYIHIVL